VNVFDVIIGEVVYKMSGHTEEILALKLVTFKNMPYALSGSQDGRIIKWLLKDDYRYCSLALFVFIYIYLWLFQALQMMQSLYDVGLQRSVPLLC